MKLGIFGGTFNPVHNEHMNMAREAIRELELDKLVILPCGEPPHKKEDHIAARQARLDMCRLAFTDEKMEVSDFEIEKKGKSYTYETLEHFAGEGVELFFLLGGDSLNDIYKWKNPEEIFEMATLVATGRNSRKYCEQLPAHKSKVKLLKYESSNLSSTELRVRVEFGDDVSKDVPSAVNEYIIDNKLYTEYRKYTEKVKKMITPSRYIHTMGTTITGMKLAKAANVSEENAFLACALHDAAKSMTDFSQFKGKLAAEDMLIPEPVIHAFVGSYILKKEFGIKDNDIRNAIKYHTTARPNMSNLEKLVYVSDCIEPSRKYDGVDDIRSVVEQDFERGFVMCLNSSFSVVADKTICPLTLDAIDYYGK